MITALIFAGGTGQRMRSADIPKQFLKVGGKPIIIRTIEHFSLHDEVDNIVVVCLESWINELKADILKYDLRKIELIIPGGDTGYQSIHKGLLAVAEKAKDDDIVLICDGVRPMLTKELISQCISDTVKYGSAVPVTSSIDSVLESSDGKLCSKKHNRSNIFITQAPQGYTVKKIMDAHRRAEERGIESVSSADLMIELGEEIHIFQGIRENIKVTTKEDLNALRATHYYENFKSFAEEELNHG